MLEGQKSKYANYSSLAIWATVTTAIFLITCILGEGLGGSLGGNDMCYKYLGCTSGFFGYDALEHFLFGIAAVLIIIWLFKKFPKFSMFYSEFWKNFLVIISLVMLVSVFWEFAECAHDYFRIEILHQSLVNFKLHINHLDQPTNIDTMGDLTFALIGSIVSLFFTKKEITTKE